MKPLDFERGTGFETAARLFASFLPFRARRMRAAATIVSQIQNMTPEDKAIARNTLVTLRMQQFAMSWFMAMTVQYAYAKAKGYDFELDDKWEGLSDIRLRIMLNALVATDVIGFLGDAIVSGVEGMKTDGNVLQAL